MDGSAGTDSVLRRSEIIQSALDYLSANYSARISVSELASHMFLSPGYFGKLFRDATGMSVTAFLRRARIGEACRLLAESESTISDIAVCCGFCDMKRFYSAFRSETGTTPGQYRKSSLDSSSREVSSKI